MNQNYIWRNFVIVALILSGFFVFAQNTQAATTWKVHSSGGITGATENNAISSMAIFNGSLYLGVANSAGSRIFRQSSNSASSGFEAVATLGTTTNIPALEVFSGYLYAGTTAATGWELYRSLDGTTWSAVTIGGNGDANNTSIGAMAIFNNRLNVGTRNTATGTEVWSCTACDNSDWAQLGVDGLGNANNTQTLSLKSFGGRLVAGTYNSTAGQGGEVRYYDTGTGTWVQFNTGGFDDGSRNAGIRLETFGTTLYAGTERTNSNGLEIWSNAGLTNNWTEVIGDSTSGFGSTRNTAAMSLYSYTYETSQTRLVVGTRNATSGGEIWESTDGTTWSSDNSVIASQVLNISNAANDDEVRSLLAKNSEGASTDKHLYAGILNSTNGGEVWQRDFAPVVSVSTPSQSTDGTGIVPFSFDVDDYDGDTLTARVQYSTADGACVASGNAGLSSTATSTSGTNPIVNNSSTYQISNIITTSASGGYTISGSWRSQSDEQTTFSTSTCLSITGYDSFNTATTQETDTDRTNTFTLDNADPNPPTLNDVTSPTKTTPQTISGTKDIHTSVILNGTTIVSSNASTSWSYSLSLIEGTNSLSLTSKDSFGNESSATSGSIILDTTAPATCSASPAGGNYTGKVDVELKADDALDPDPYVYYTTNGDTPTATSQKFKDKGTVSLTADATIKFFCQDWLGNKTSVKSEIYVVTEPQILLTKTAQVGFGAAPAGLAIGVRDILLPTPQKSWQNVSVLVAKTHESLKIPDAYLYKFLRGFWAVILGLALFYLILVFDAELKIKGKKRAALISILQKNYGKFTYALPIILAVFIFINLFISVSLIAENIKVDPNDTITYTLSYKNEKNKKASNVEISDTLPDYVDYKSGGTLDGDTVKFDIGDLSGNAEGSVQFSVQVKNTAKNAGLISNTATGLYDSATVNNIPFTSNTLTYEVEAQGKISGYVFYDSNADKIKSGESGISGVIVRIYEDLNQNGILDSSDPLIASRITNSVGYFEMLNAYAAFYLIKSDTPSGYKLTTSSNPVQVVLKTSLEEVANVNFGFLAVAGPTPIISPIVTATPSPTETPIETLTPTPTITESPSPTPIIKKITEPITKTTEKVKKTVKKIQETITKILPKILTEPITQETTKKVVGPLLFLLPLLNLLTGFPSSVMWQFLRYLIQVFSEPFIYFGKGARRNWGVVYNSLTKQPIDLATVRLFDKASGRLLESRVTDFEGRYMFIVDFGKEYYLEVRHRDYIFPSKFMARVSRDSDYDHIYHGEAIATGKVSDVRKKEQGIVTFNIPLDPQEGLVSSEDLPHRPIYSKIKDIAALEKSSEKKRKLEDRRIILAMVLRKANFVVGFLGPILSLFSLIIAPSWITLLFLVLHLLVLAFFLKLAKKKVSLPWGKTFELKTKEGLAGSIIRLFDEKYGRMLSVAVTKGGGRYGFLTGRENYILMAHKPEYILPQGRVKVRPSREKIVKEDLGMEKSSRSKS